MWDAMYSQVANELFSIAMPFKFEIQASKVSWPIIRKIKSRWGIIKA